MQQYRRLSLIEREELICRLTAGHSLCALAQAMQRAPSTVRDRNGFSMCITREEAQAEVFEFIKVFYNRQRLHQALGYVSRLQYEDARVL